jgi:hypothetical protein
MLEHQTRLGDSVAGLLPKGFIGFWPSVREPSWTSNSAFHASLIAAFLENVPDPLAAQATKADAAGFVHMAEQRASARSHSELVEIDTADLGLTDRCGLRQLFQRFVADEACIDAADGVQESFQNALERMTSSPKSSVFTSRPIRRH